MRVFWLPLPTRLHAVLTQCSCTCMSPKLLLCCCFVWSLTVPGTCSCMSLHQRAAACMHIRERAQRLARVSSCGPLKLLLLVALNTNLISNLLLPGLSCCCGTAWTAWRQSSSNRQVTALTLLLLACCIMVLCLALGLPGVIHDDDVNDYRHTQKPLAPSSKLVAMCEEQSQREGESEADHLPSLSDAFKAVEYIHCCLHCATHTAQQQQHQ